MMSFELFGPRHNGGGHQLTPMWSTGYGQKLLNLTTGGGINIKIMTTVGEFLDFMLHFKLSSASKQLRLKFTR